MVNRLKHRLCHILPALLAALFAATAVPAQQAASAPAQPVWSRNGVATPQAIALLRVLRGAADYGLNPADYLGPPLGDPAPPGGSSAVVPGFDVALTAAATQLLHDLHFGRVDPAAAGFDLPRTRPALDLPQLLDQLAAGHDTGAVLAAVEPQFIHYQLLKQALLHYRQLDAGSITPTPAEVKQAPYAPRIRQIELTLERWRWLPEFTAPPIIVNIPQFRLFAFRTLRDRRDDILQMDVIVGKTVPTTRTPVFMQDMKYLVFRPYWDVPYSITRKEIIPSIRKKPGYLSKERLELVDKAGKVVPESAESLTQLESGALRVRQTPGPDNSLGLIKFMLPNRYNVYLHSTPAHSLFNRAERAFSHGCIRVKDPVALAQHVLRDTPGDWSAAVLKSALEAGPDNTTVRLKTPIPVLIIYATALAQEDGSVLFFKDIYGHDAKLAQLLKLPAVTIARP